VSARPTAHICFLGVSTLAKREARLGKYQGTGQWFDPKKGYGFIVGPEGQDVFVHYSQIVGDGFRSLKDGDEVDYELTQGEKGFQAREVQLAQGHAAAS